MKKRLKKGAEAPAVKIFDSQDNEKIIGMIAINIQLLLCLEDLEKRVALIELLDKTFEESTKLDIYVIAQKSEDIQSFLANHSFKKVMVVSDKSDGFAKKYGAFDAQNSYFIVDKEGELQMVNYSDSDEALNISEILKETQFWLEYKPKGHVHENWMM